MPSNANLTGDALQVLKDNGEFEESKLMHSINGHMYCAGDRPMKQLDIKKMTRIYMFSLGEVVDFHSGYWGAHSQRQYWSP